MDGNVYKLLSLYSVKIFAHSYIYLSNPYAQTGCDTRSNFKRILIGLNSEFSFSKAGCHVKVKEPSLHNYLSIARGRIVRCIPFLCEILTTSSRIWTQVTVSIAPRKIIYVFTCECIHILAAYIFFKRHVESMIPTFISFFFI